jgi:hypothetical protein
MDFYSLGFPSLQDAPSEDIAGESVAVNMALGDNRTADILARSLSMEKKEGEEEPFGFAVFRKVTVPKKLNNHFKNYIKHKPALKKTEIFLII